MVVVGIGNSGGDLAVDISRVAEKVKKSYLSSVSVLFCIFKQSGKALCDFYVLART